MLSELASESSLGVVGCIDAARQRLGDFDSITVRGRALSVKALSSRANCELYAIFTGCGAVQGAVSILENSLTGGVLR